MCYPDGQGAAVGLVIDRGYMGRNKHTPDMIRVVPAHTLTDDDSLLSTLRPINYHPFHPARSCTFTHPLSILQLASVLVEKTLEGGTYSLLDHNCYWYADAVFQHCLDTYRGNCTDFKHSWWHAVGKVKGVEAEKVVCLPQITTRPPLIACFEPQEDALVMAGRFWAFLRPPK